MATPPSHRCPLNPRPHPSPTSPFLALASSPARLRDGADDDEANDRTQSDDDRKLDTEPGMNRFVWDLRYPGPWSVNGGGRSGPFVLPGRYQVRMRLGDVVDESYLLVELDPRLDDSGITTDDLEQQLVLTRRLHAAIGRGRRRVRGGRWWGRCIRAA